ncbi:MAG TPA: hypothetical protein VGJ74_16905 [Burkholderiales bacterium]|jgi:hypothetical protein
MRFDYPNLETLSARAREERAAAVHDLIVAPLARFFAGLKTRQAPLRASRWLAVHGK